MFVKGHLAFTIDGHQLEFIHQNISVFGVTGLPWAPLKPEVHFGKPVQVQIRIPSTEPLTFKTRAYILREQTLYAEHMGLRFLLDAEQKASLQKLVSQKGFYPTEYVRKYPRIPSSASIQTFPLRVMAMPHNVAHGLKWTDQPPMILEICNLSPNGILLSSENQMAQSLIPGQKMDLVIEPRGWFPHSVEVEGLICRITDELQPSNGNLIRYLGVKFSAVDESNKAVFLELLKDILERIKKAGG